MLELLTTLIIILVLVGILIPVVKRMREKAQEASVKAQLGALDSAINRYQQDFGAFPGVLPRGRLYSPKTPGQATGIFDTANNGVVNVSGAENLVLSLLGGLRPLAAATGSTPATFTFDRALLGSGPRNLHPSNPKRSTAYIDGMILSEGAYTDGSGTATDSVIPEILDRFSNPMPILYLRAQPGAHGVVSLEDNDTASNNPVLLPAGTPTQYDIREIIGYTALGSNGSIGEGKSIKVSDYKNNGAVSPNALPHGLRTVDETASADKGNAKFTYPYDAFTYFSNPSIPPTDLTAGKQNATGTPRNKDRYMLISAGVDRVFGTPDDITNAGEVIQ